MPCGLVLRGTTEDEDVVFAWLVRGGCGRSDEGFVEFRRWWDVGTMSGWWILSSLDCCCSFSESERAMVFRNELLQRIESN